MKRASKWACSTRRQAAVLASLFGAFFLSSIPAVAMTGRACDVSPTIHSDRLTYSPEIPILQQMPFIAIDSGTTAETDLNVENHPDWTVPVEWQKLEFLNGTEGYAPSYLISTGNCREVNYPESVDEMEEDISSLLNGCSGMFNDGQVRAAWQDGGLAIATTDTVTGLQVGYAISVADLARIDPTNYEIPSYRCLRGGCMMSVVPGSSPTQLGNLDVTFCDYSDNMLFISLIDALIVRLRN